MRHFIGLIILAAALALTQSPAPVHAERQNPYFGTLAPTTTSSDGYDSCSEAIQLGVGWIRTTFFWDAVQPTDAPIDFSGWDSALDCFENAGIQVYLSLDNTPPWISGTNTDLPDSTDWQTWVATVLAHYSARYGSNITFGIWNEPEGGSLTNCPGGMDQGSCYGQYLYQPAAAVRDSIDTSIALGGPEMGTTDSRYSNAMSYMLPVMQPQDVVTLHYYTDDYTTARSNFLSYFGTGTSGASGYPVWLTETGVNQCDDQTQATQLFADVGNFSDAMSEGLVSKFFYYLVGAVDVSCWSLARSDGSHRAAFDTYGNVVSPPVYSPPPPATIDSGGGLLPGNTLTSTSGQYELLVTDYGDLQLWDTYANAIVWDTGSDGTGYIQFRLESDGDMVIYADENLIWDSGTGGSYGYLVVENDGNLIEFDQYGNCVWTNAG